MTSRSAPQVAQAATVERQTRTRERAGPQAASSATRAPPAKGELRPMAAMDAAYPTYAVSADAPPDGTYFMTQYLFYNGATAETHTRKQTIVYAGGHVQLATKRDDESGAGRDV